MKEAVVFVLKNFFYTLQVARLIDFVTYALTLSRLENYENKTGCKINFVPQGEGGVRISGDLAKFFIDKTSHLKSNTYIECSGGVRIGKCFHVGRGLTIFSTNHNWRSEIELPYDDIDILKPVIIDDFVWCGANVTILPGVKIGKGAVVAGGSVVARDVPPCMVVGGNPAVIIEQRDKDVFERLFKESKFKSW